MGGASIRSGLPRIVFGGGRAAIRGGLALLGPALFGAPLRGGEAAPRRG
jgi:hypothetical protein